MSIMIGSFLLIAVMMYRKTATVANKPVKKLEEMINIHRNVNKNLQLVNDNNTRIMNELKENVLSGIRNSLEDLTIVARQTKDAVEASSAFPRPRSLVSTEKKTDAGAKSFSKPEPEHKTSKIKSRFGGFAKIIKKDSESKKFEDTLEKLQEFKDRPEKEVDTSPIPITDPDKVLKEPPYTQEDVKSVLNPLEPNGDVEIVNEKIEPSYNDEGMVECDTCGDAMEEMLQCPHCTRVYCNQHYDDHKCLKDIPSEPSSFDKEKLKKAGTFFKEQFVEPKPPKLTDDASIIKSMEMGTSHAMILKQLEDEFMKSSRKQNEELYQKLNQEYANEPSMIVGMKLSAMVNVLNKQVRY